MHAVGAVLLSLLAVTPDLGLGDPAPELTIGAWVKGDPVDLGELEGKIAVVEFWATWCVPCRKSIPHLTEIQKKYAKKGVVVIGISSGEDLRRVQAFVKDQADGMDYTVAVDSEAGKTSEDWMEAAGEGGIPTAFVVDKGGKIAWIGHPLEGLDDAIEGILAGTHSVEKAKRKRAVMERFQEAFRKGDEEEFGKLADEVEEMDLTSRDDLRMRFHILVMAKRDEKAKAAGEKLLEKLGESVEDLNSFAWDLLTRPPFRGRFADLALEAATGADRLAEGKSWEIIDTLALARFETGDAEGAVELQRKAIDMARKEGADERALEQLEKALKRFDGE